MADEATLLRKYSQGIGASIEQYFGAQAQAGNAYTGMMVANSLRRCLDARINPDDVIWTGLINSGWKSFAAILQAAAIVVQAVVETMSSDSESVPEDEEDEEDDDELL